MKNRIQMYGVAAEIDHRRKTMTEEHLSRVPLRECGSNDEVIEELVLSRIRRLRALQYREEEDCERIAEKNGKESVYWQVENAILQVITAVLKVEVWMQYPELIGREDFKFYKGWAIGREKVETKNGDLFNPTEVKKPETRARDVVSTRSDDIRPNQRYDFRYDERSAR